jgi:hypothetical protein
VKTAIAVIIDVDGQHCGDCCFRSPAEHAGGYVCDLVGVTLDHPLRAPGPLRCDACLRAEERMQQATRGKGRGAPDIRGGWKTWLAREGEAR